MAFIILYVTHPSESDANDITNALLENRLIACANIFPIESVYWWEGSLAKSKEFVTIYKTLPEKYEAIESYILENHKYEIPCIMKVASVQANISYENWIRSELTIIS